MHACLERLISSSPEKSLVLLGTSSKDATHNLDAGILSVFSTTINVHVPSQDDRQRLIEKWTRRIRLEDIFLDSHAISVSTAGLGIDDLHACLANAASACFDRVSGRVDEIVHDNELKDVDSISKADIFQLSGLSNQDIQKALTGVRAHYSESIGAAKIPKVFWSDIGGLEHVKKTILETIQLPMIHPELFESGVKKRSGVLLYGPPGTGIY